MKLFFLHLLHRIDWILLSLAAAISGLGLVLIASAGATIGARKLLIIQIGALGIGLLLALALLVVEHENLARLSWALGALCVLALIATLVFGKEVNGNKNWISMGPVNIQPSEFVKVGFIVTFAYHLSKVRRYINRLRALVPLALHFGVLVGLVFLEGDLGTTLVFVFIFAAMLLAAGLHWGYFAAAFGLVGLASPFIFDHLNDYQQKRILAVYDPDLDPLGFGYQINQSKIAIGSGRLSGEGWGRGIQTQYSILPEKQTDFIFAVCGEELGFIGCFLIIALEVALVLRLLYIARHASDHLGCFICTGIAAMILFQSAVSVGMCVGLLPVVGITLPFVSYGGSSALSLAMSLGLAMSVNANRRREGFFK